ncbi:deacetylase complex subunit [Colletotrichum plurivorum]|uniref:Deacetylase complex subunit n=1 Tax=Colletotrichum plurivorum TaxID=2175906 RepID=A0A8H6NJC6_9PEZI|nr:deacetylase complex subunit [Colletotrichum plurivorum]
MAANETAIPNLGGAAGQQKASRGSPAPQSKRDRKRQVLADKINSLQEKFNRDRDHGYRDQLQKVQLDTNLVQRIDPYDSEDVLRVIASLRREHDETQPPEPLADNNRTLLQMAGPKFEDFVQGIEDLVEYRDFHLLQHLHEHERRLHQYKNEYLYKVETAKREHSALSSTLRDRLVNTLLSRKYRLNKEKEALEISDSSALLLHPNQFSITNPASPGGTHGKRATRLRKDAEELSGYSDSKKRKRNPGEDDGSPAPSRRALDPNSTTPLWQNEKLRVAAKQNGPAYSIDKLFTEKELTMAYNAAAIAAHKHILRHKAYANGGSSPGSDSGHGEDCDQDSEAFHAAPMMERTSSHATRSTRAGINQNLIDAVEGANGLDLPKYLEILHPHEPAKLPSSSMTNYFKPVRGNTDANLPQSLSQDEIASDIMIMDLFKKYDANHKPGDSIDHPNGSRRLLEASIVPYTKAPWTGFKPGPRPDPTSLTDDLQPIESSARDEPPPPSSLAAVAAVPMSRTSSAAGGAAMSRQGSSRGKGRKNQS